MKCLFVLDLPPHQGTLGKTFLDAFINNGIEVVSIYPQVENTVNDDSLKARVLNRLRIALRLQEADLYAQIQQLDLADIDFVFVMKGAYFNLKAFALLQGKPVFCYNPDDPYNRASCGENIRKVLPKYSACFIWSKPLVNKIQTEEKIRSYFVPFAADLSLYSVPITKDKLYPVSFIGNFDDERERWMSAIERVDQLHIFGANWKRKCRSEVLIGRFFEPKVLGKFSDTVQRSIININILREQNKNSNNMRSFEVPACKGFSLHEYSDEMASVFTEGESIEFFRTPKELNQKIEYYLANPDKAEKIAQCAYEQVLAEELTYDNRVRQIITTIQQEYLNES